MKHLVKLILLSSLIGSCNSFPLGAVSSFQDRFRSIAEKKLVGAIETGSQSTIVEVSAMDRGVLFASGEGDLTPLFVSVAVGNREAFTFMVNLGAIDQLTADQTRRVLSEAAFVRDLFFLRELIRHFDDLAILYQGRIGFLERLVLSESELDHFSAVASVGLPKGVMSRALETAIDHYLWDYVLILLENGADPNYNKYIVPSLVEKLRRVTSGSPDRILRSTLDKILDFLLRNYSIVP